jgi:hypothetical protein
VTAEGLWTVDEACQWFTAQGHPADPAQLRGIIRWLHWTPAGEGPSGPSGGRGCALYPISHLMRLHQRVTELAGLPRGDGT